MKVLRINLLTLCLITIITFMAAGQQLNNNWESDLKASLQEFMTCNDACYKFHGMSLKTVYNINDFYSTVENRYMTTNEINTFLSTNKTWEKLGPAYDPKALTMAQDHANAKMAAIAIYLDENGLGHMALILPGELQASGSWGVKVPNSASFLIADPSKAYVGKSLSYAFKRSQLKDVVLYGKKY